MSHRSQHEQSGIQFKSGDRVMNIYSMKVGTVNKLRNDSHECQYSWPRNSYHYSVDYDDGTFDTYESQTSLTKAG